MRGPDKFVECHYPSRELQGMLSISWASTPVCLTSRIGQPDYAKLISMMALAMRKRKAPS